MEDDRPIRQFLRRYRAPMFVAAIYAAVLALWVTALVARPEGRGPVLIFGAVIWGPVLWAYLEPLLQRVSKAIR
jgi:hypothetical protein